MFDEFETRPQHFFIPTIIAIVGGIFAQFESWKWVGYGIGAVAGVCTFWLFYSSYKKHEYDLIRAEQDHLAEIIKLDAARTTTTVAIEKTDLTGYLYKNFSTLNIPSIKLAKFAQGVMLHGQKMTIREWTPLKEGKLFSDPEWRRLIAFMKAPDWEDEHIKFIVPINPNNENDSYELTAAGKRWLRGILEDSVLSPV